MNYCIYLRKSRADAEAETRGEGETLSKHEHILLALAKRMQVDIDKIYKEIVSGETIAARPVVQQLLSDVEKRKWDGVFVMEIERLARGDTMDQGFMAQVFKYSGTKIITPIKIYDPENPFDEEYFEFGLFMSRREFKTINRRLQLGRQSSAQEGNFLGSIPPYGYQKIKAKQGKGFTLKPIPQEAEIIKQIYISYAIGCIQEDGTRVPIGISKIAKNLNSLHIKPKKGEFWSASSVRDILINPVYIGKIRWNFRPVKKIMNDGILRQTRPRNDKNHYILNHGKHVAIISEALFMEAQKRMQQNPPHPVAGHATLKNPLSGIVICSKCGRTMQRRPSGKNGKSTLMCPEPSCNNISVSLEEVEKKILDALRAALQSYSLNSQNSNRDLSFQTNAIQTEIKFTEKQLKRLHQRLDRLYTLLEENIYTKEIFLTRSFALKQAIEKNTAALRKLNVQLNNQIHASKTPPPSIDAVPILKFYNKLPSAQAKNELLKQILEKVVYTKTKNGQCKNTSPDDFEIILYPKIPFHKDKT